MTVGLNEFAKKKKGLTSAEAKDRLKEYGYNELAISTKKSFFVLLVEIFREPMFILLVSSAIIYIFLGDYREGLILLGATSVIIFITFFQYRKAENALLALKKLADPQALVLRDNLQKMVPGREIVPDDLVYLNEGDRVVADAVLIEEQHLWLDEAILTGESMPVKKTAKDPIFAGTLVIQGTGIASITATGVSSKFGKIGLSLNDIKEDMTKLQLEMNTLIKHLFLIGILISVAVVIAFYITRGGIINAILNGIATSMAVLPEEFPVVLTVFLAIGAWRLSKIQVLTRKPSAIETLGAVTVLCVDKTGTITMNSMNIAYIYNGVSVIGKEQLNEKDHAAFDLIESARLASAPNAVNPMEKAILTLTEMMPQIKNHFSSINKDHIVHAYPLSNDSPCMTNVYASKEDSSFYYFTKGAPEYIFKLCSLDDVEIEMHEAMLNSMAQKSFRVIAIATAVYPNTSFPDNQSTLTLNFKGLMAFEDPIRQEVATAMLECKAAGVKVKMITGDFPITAKSIAEQIGLDKEGMVLSGEVLDKMTESELLDKMNSISVFARVIPSQKLRIVNALKMQNEIVAMTGDGVNDAPALKAAHIGIAMGKRGTEVAREAASLVLLDDNFASIVAAIRQGRKIFDNLQKAMGYILAIHIPIIGLTLLPVLNPFFPFILLPLHIICLELVIDPIASVAFESESEEKNIMQRPPRSAMALFFGPRKIIVSLIKGSALLVMVLLVFFIGKQQGLNDQALRTTSYTALVLGNIVLVLNSLSKTKPFFYSFINKNWTALGILLFALVLLASAVLFPSMQSLFKFNNPGLAAFGLVFLLVFILLAGLELQKYFTNLSTNNNQHTV